MSRLPRIAASLPELAEMVGVAERTLRRWAREEGMPTYRVGGRVLVHIGDFEVWLRQHQDPTRKEVDSVVQTIVERVSEASG